MQLFHRIHDGAVIESVQLEVSTLIKMRGINEQTTDKKIVTQRKKNYIMLHVQYSNYIHSIGIQENHKMETGLIRALGRTKQAEQIPKRRVESAEHTKSTQQYKFSLYLPPVHVLWNSEIKD